MDELMTPEHAQALERLRAGWGRLDGRSVLVTGATRGIGLETAVRLAGLGADVLVHGRDAAPRSGRPRGGARRVRSGRSSGAVHRRSGLARRRPPPGGRGDTGPPASGRPRRERGRVRSRAARDGGRSRADVRRQRRRAHPPGDRAPAGAARRRSGAHRRPELGLALDRRDLLGRPAARRPGRLRRDPRLRPVQARRAHADARPRAAARGQRRHCGLPRPGRRRHRACWRAGGPACPGSPSRTAP